MRNIVALTLWATYDFDIDKNNFAKENYLQTHIKIEHLGETKKHQCEICNNEYNLNVHY